MATIVDPHYSRLVDRIRNGDSESEQELYRQIGSFVKAPLEHLLGTAAEDLVHDVYIEVLTALRDAELREASRLKAFTTTIAMRLAWAQIYRAKRFQAVPVLELDSLIAREDSTFDSILLGQFRRSFCKALETLRPSEREILDRFYLRAQPAEKIREDMNLGETQYRLLKSRAKKRCERKLAASFGSRPPMSWRVT